MSLHAVENVDDALDATREYLLPFELRRWLKLAVVVFFLGTGTSLPTTGFNGSSGGTTDGVSGAELPTTLPDGILPFVVAAVVVVVVAAVAFAVVGAIMEFVFVESLRSHEVAVRRYWSERWRQGLRLFGFRVAIGLPLLVVSVAWVGLFFGPAVLDVGWSIPFAVFLLGLPVLFVGGLLYGLVSSFTTVFVVPIMIETDSGVLSAWRRLWPSVRSDPKEYLVYLVLSLVLSLAAGVGASLVVALVAVVVLVPLAVVGVVTHLAVTITSTAGLVVAGVLAVVFVVAVVGCWALAQVPVVAYLRYYGLLVLGDIEESFDLIPDQRAAVRESDETTESA
jgi:hypothetical protein